METKHAESTAQAIVVALVQSGKIPSWTGNPKEQAEQTATYLSTLYLALKKAFQ